MRIAALLALTVTLVASPSIQPRAQTLLKQAETRAAAGDFAGAMTAYMDAVTIDRNAADLQYVWKYTPNVTELRISEADPNADAAEKARVVKAREPYVAALRQFLDIHPSDMRAIEALLAVLEPRAAESALESIIRIRPDDPHLYAVRGEVRANDGRFLDALADLEKARDLDPANAQRHYEAATVAHQVAKRETGLSAQQKRELLNRSLASLDRASALIARPEEVVPYRHLVLIDLVALDLEPPRSVTVTAAPARTASTSKPAGPLRVGGDVKAPVILSRVEPVYPEEAKPHRITGIVIVEVVIDKSGRVTEGVVLKDLPYGVGAAALDAVRQWTFRPGTLNGEPVDVIFNLVVNMRPPQ